jgi:hypothetical protein
VGNKLPSSLSTKVNLIERKDRFCIHTHQMPANATIVVMRAKQAGQGDTVAIVLKSGRNLSPVHMDSLLGQI